ncbi:MAG: hypothetical protein J6O62_03110 [Bacilli bacterium]|nr:hypothetical protein [Bacilli bacterium]MBO6195714.1 hypothetical protein [Bacilli bacterium]
MEKKITKEILDYYDSKRKLTESLGFKKSTDEQREAMDIVSNTLKKIDITETDETISLDNSTSKALESLSLFDKKYINKICKFEYMQLDDLPEDEYTTRIAFRQLKGKVLKHSGKVFNIEIPQKITTISPIWLGHEYIHALKETNYKEYILKNRTSEILTFFYEFLIVEKCFPKLHDLWKQKRLSFLNYDNVYYKEAKKRKNENPKTFEYIQDTYGQYLSSYYYALNLYYLYKQNPKEILKYIKKVLDHKMTTEDLINRLDISQVNRNSNNVYILGHERL